MRNIDRSKIIFEDPRWQYLETPASFGHLRCYLGGDDGRTPVIIITELVDNRGRSVTNSIEDIAELVEAAVLPYLTMLSDQQRKAYILAEEYRHVNYPWTLDQVTFPIPTGVVTRSGGSPRWMPTTYEKLGLALDPNDLKTSMSENIIIVTETVEPGAMENESNSAVITVEKAWLEDKAKIARGLAAQLDEFSELRLFSYSAEFRRLSVSEIVEYLRGIADDESDLRVSTDDMIQIDESLDSRQQFVWPASVVLDFDKLSDNTYLASLLRSELNELVFGPNEYQAVCYFDDQECKSAWIPYGELGLGIVT